MAGVRQERKEQTRARIVAVATRLFLERAYDEVTLADLLAAAQVQKGGFYHHFPDKRAAFRAAYLDVNEGMGRKLEEAARGSADPAQALAAAMDRFFREMGDSPGLHRFFYRDGLAVLGWADWIAINKAHSLAALDRGVAQLAAAGRLRSAHPGQFATLLAGAADYLADAALEAGEGRAAAVAAANAAVRELIGHYCRPGGS